MLDETILIILDIIGISAFSLSGYIIATKSNLDILGVILISFITSLGGGVIKDLIVNNTPNIFQHSYPFITVLLVVFFSYIFKIHNYKEEKLNENKIFIIFDSIGLSIFTISGALLGIENNLNLGGVLFLGLITAVGGGILRDISLNKIPFILKNEFYGTISLISSLFLYILNVFDLLIELYIVLVIILTFVLRIIAIKRCWKLPKILIN
jgi:uncharacterized membrane protein YeiH